MSSIDLINNSLHEEHQMDSSPQRRAGDAMSISSLLTTEATPNTPNVISTTSNGHSVPNGVGYVMTNGHNVMDADDLDDIVRYDFNGTDTPESIRIANSATFAMDKQEYILGLQQRFDYVMNQDSRDHEEHFMRQMRQSLDSYTFKSEEMRKLAQKELIDRAMNRVLRAEEAELKEKRRLLKRMERQRKKADAAHQQQEAAAAAGDVKAGTNEVGDERGTMDEVKSEKEGSRAKRKSKKFKEPEITPAKKSLERSAKRKHSLTADEASPSGTRTKIKLTHGGNASKLSKDASKTAAKPPSQKEIKAIARLYSNTYDSIWKDMARKDASKISKVIQACANVRQSNAKKTAILASKEARRWQYRTNKSMKDLQAKAKRGMREMLVFWKRNEREERDLRRKAEKEALDQAKKEEELREARRQARKLNFLITQTELYSHFIGRKIKTDEAMGDGAPASTNKNIPDGEVDASHAAPASELDFDAAHDDDLQKAAMANAHNAVLQAQNRARSFGQGTEVKSVDIDSEEMNFQNPTSLGDMQIPQPKMLRCQLKEYQIKGLNWLANLYEQGINGILADEMGLGKTVQSISVMAYLAETHNIWGPFLVIAPVSTLHNWQQEISRFIPEFKALPYWGNSKDRKVLRKFWDRKQLTYTKDSPFHVLITSYQLVVADAQYFQRVKWQYMVLDEAQAIKSSSSTRWKSLLSFQCRNRLLLTGTPIQNSMQELWALLHFIMPSLFDSHEEFSEWFSKDIESHAQTNTQLNEQQLKRLHMILKPFMLRRVKKHVQQELGDKIEIDVHCNLTNRQRVLYKMLRSQISLMDLIERATSGSDEGQQSLMNLVMQFRKVCNHPDLFERADVKSAFNFGTFGDTSVLNRDGPIIDVSYSAQNHIELTIPKILYREGGVLNIPGDYSNAGSKNRMLEMFNVWSNDNISKSAITDGAFGWLAFSGNSANEVSGTARQGLFERALDRFRVSRWNGEASSIYDEDNDDNNKKAIPADKLFLIAAEGSNKSKLDVHNPVIRKLVTVADQVAVDNYYHVHDKAYDSSVLCPPISIFASDRGLVMEQQDLLFNEKIRSSLYPMTLDKEWDLLEHGATPADFPPSDLYPPADNPRAGLTTIRMPSMTKFVTDSGKLQRLDQLLVELKANDHRVLIYFQMTKMMDLMEEYLTFRQYKYVRLDGSSKLSDRRDLVNDWQTKPELFVFLLSTRAGGLGINLTAADTVIFYDSDWNPTIDSQAMDRAHRLGQTKQVTVYRLLVRGTIEERMRDRAKQKMHVQSMVMEGKTGDDSSSVDFQKPGREVAYWLLDDDAAVSEALKNKERERQLQYRKGKKANNNNNNNGNGNGPGIGLGNGIGNGKKPPATKARRMSLEEMYHEDEGNFDESGRPSEIVTPASTSGTSTPVVAVNKGHKRMTTEQRLKAVGNIE